MMRASKPWELEAQMLSSSSFKLPFNIDGNYCTVTTAPAYNARRLARKEADRLGVVRKGSFLAEH
jgi:hypothetical protein